jgi:peroxiredoxin family protein
MNHIKLYEDFFSFFLYDKLTDSDINMLFGISREDIEDALIEINDLGLYNISINFKINNGFLNSTDYYIQAGSYTSKKYDDDGEPLSHGKKGYTNQIESLGVEIHIYLTRESLDKIDKRGEFQRERVISTDILIPKLLECYNQLKSRFNNFDISERHRAFVNNAISFHPEEKVHYGDAVMSIYMKKRPQFN